MARLGHGKLAQELRDLVRGPSKEQGARQEARASCPAEGGTGEPRIGRLLGYALVQHGRST